MKAILPILLGTAVLLVAEEEAVAPERAANTIILDEVSARNLGIELAEAVETDFEETIFAIGRIDEIPTNHAVLSSRIAGRIVELNAIPGDEVKAGQVLVRVESRQPGNPPPVIPLAAPISGTVLESHVRVGEPVDPANELLDIVDLSEVWAIARVPEQEAGRIKVGATGRIRVAALPGETFVGELIRFGIQADATAGTLDAIFRLENPDRHLRPGMRAEFSIITETRSDVMAVPHEAVQGDAANRVVYVEDFELPNAFIKCPVQTGARNDRYVEIVNGLFPGDRVVTTGSYFLGSAGGGGVSLKEALDAAHGHEHNEDGSLMTDEQKRARDAARGVAPEGGASTGPLTVFLGVTVCILTFLLLLSGIKHRRDGRTLATALQASNPPRPGPDA
ncbi:MAG: efflux RND transporter periplasmic adaptor subunit [Akkermansiaceae bacterium]|nr:efflux RND transporter periplasmic adaptor subunit [Akkermansiaceae bacterium]NNM30031.1 efflux RND transporter periplasmic adaptor subunit [Akkermansiaceae bacterium]